MGGYWPYSQIPFHIEIFTTGEKHCSLLHPGISDGEKKSNDMTPGDAEVCLEAPDGLVTTGDNGIKRFLNVIDASDK